MGIGNSSFPGPEKAEKLISANPVMIFSATYCSFCKVAKRTFDDLGTEYNVLELDQIPDGPEMAKSLSYITGNNLVPQVFICGELIGGGSEIRRLFHSGDLAKRVQICCQGDLTCHNRYGN